MRRRRGAQQDVPLARFRIYAEIGTPPYWRFNVLVFETGAAMNRYAQRHFNSGTTAYLAVYFFPPPGTADKKRLLGTMLFQRRHLDPGLVAHECLHAIFHWYRRTTENTLLDIEGSETGVSDLEEWITTRTGELVSQAEKRLARIRKR